MNLLLPRIVLTGILVTVTFFTFSQELQQSNDRYVIVLDVQQFWTENSLKPDAADKMIRSINLVIENTNPSKIIYIKSEGESAVLSISFKGIKKTTYIAGEFSKDLKVVNSSIFYKNTGDAFSVKEMTDIFETNNAKEIIITGLLAEECVYKTALGGIAANYKIYLVPDAIGGKSEKSKNRAINKLVKAGATTIMSDLL